MLWGDLSGKNQWWLVMGVLSDVIINDSTDLGGGMPVSNWLQKGGREMSVRIFWGRVGVGGGNPSA